MVIYYQAGMNYTCLYDGNTAAFLEQIPKKPTKNKNPMKTLKKQNQP